MLETLHTLKKQVVNPLSLWFQHQFWPIYADLNRGHSISGSLGFGCCIPFLYRSKSGFVHFSMEKITHVFSSYIFSNGSRMPLDFLGGHLKDLMACEGLGNACWRPGRGRFDKRGCRSG